MSGWIKLHRQLMEWEWYQDSKMVHLYLHMLMKANREPRKWKGVQVDAGQFIGGRESLSIATGISERSIRTCLDRLKDCGLLTSESTNKHTLFTLVKWRSVVNGGSGTDQQSDQQTTSKRPANDQQTTTNKKVEKVENGKKEKKDTNVSKENTAPSSLDVEFDIFWRGCQRKVDKDKARAAWKRMRKEKHTDLTATELMERYNKAVDFAVEAYGSKTKSPMPSTWINKRRWNDEIEEPPKKFPFTLPQMEEGGYSGAIYPDLRGQRFYMEPREGGKVFDEQGNELNLIESDGEGYVAPRLCGTK